MADTTFVDEVTVIEPAWLNDLNDFFYTTFGGQSGGGITAATGRTSLGLGTISTQDSDSVTITGGSISGVTGLNLPDDLITTRGDLIRGSFPAAAERLALGSAGQVLSSDGTDVSWDWGGVIQKVESTLAIYSSTIALIPLDDTIPQNTEGTELLTVTLTPKSTTNRLVLDLYCPILSHSAAGAFAIGAFFQDSTAGALAAATTRFPATATYYQQFRMRHEMAAGTTSSTTFKFRLGTNTGTLYYNGSNASRLFGGITNMQMVVTEYGV